MSPHRSRIDEELERYVKSEPPPSGPPPHDRRPSFGSRLKRGADAVKHIHVILVLGVLPLGAGLWQAVMWFVTRPGRDELATVASSCASAAATAERKSAEAVAAVDAGFVKVDEQDRNWDKQDAINRDVWKRTTRERTTPPPALGPKAKAEGRQ